MASSGGPRAVAVAARRRASARASSAQRASWNARRRSPAGDRAARAGGAARAPTSRATRARARARRARTARPRAARRGSSAHENGRCRRRARPAPRRARAAVSASSTAALIARGGCSTSTPTRSPRPNGSSRRASSAPAELAGDERGQHVAGEPALGVVGDAAAQQLERDDRDRLVQREPVELGQRAARPWPRPATPAAASAGSPLPSGGRAHDRQRERAALRARRRARSRGARRRGARSRSSSRSASTRLVGRAAARCARRTSSSPRASKISAGPPISDGERARRRRRGPRSESTIRSSRSCAESARCSTAYCSLTRCENAFSVTAMNGTLVGHLEEREAALARPPRAAPRAPRRARSRCRARARRARGRRAARRTRAGASASSSRMPVVSSSSPPDSHGVGSRELGDVHPAHGASRPASPATSADVEVADQVARGGAWPCSAGRSAAAREASSSTGRRTASHLLELLRARRSAAARAGSPGRRGRRRGRSARGVNSSAREEAAQQPVRTPRR